MKKKISTHVNFSNLFHQTIKGLMRQDVLQPTMRSIYVIVDFRMLGQPNISKKPLTKDEIACHEWGHVVREVGMSVSDLGSPKVLQTRLRARKILVLTHIQALQVCSRVGRVEVMQTHPQSEGNFQMQLDYLF